MPYLCAIVLHNHHKLPDGLRIEIPQDDLAGPAIIDPGDDGPFVAGLGYANTTVFADESGQRQVLVDAVSRMFLEGQSAADALAAAATAEQAILDGYYNK